jgi:Flp pilus assembly pilin Flp
MKRDDSFRGLMRRIHNDERGAVSLETILIIGAIAIPILIFLVKIGWPMVRDMFNNRMEELDAGSENVANDQSF